MALFPENLPISVMVLVGPDFDEPEITWVLVYTTLKIEHSETC